MCAMKLGCMASLQGGGCEMSKAWAFGLDGDYVYVAKKGERLVATKKYLLLPEVCWRNSRSGSYWGSYLKSEELHAFWNLVAGAAAQYCCRMPLQGVRVLLALWSLVAGAAARCRCGAFALWSLVAGGGARCCCTVLLRGPAVPLQGAAVKVPCFVIMIPP